MRNMDVVDFSGFGVRQGRNKDSPVIWGISNAVGQRKIDFVK